MQMTPSSTRSAARARGVYYTPSFAAREVARWAVRQRAAHVLEPSTGDGVFLRALQDVGQEDDLDLVVTGVECSPVTLRSVVARGLLDPARAIISDFLAVPPAPMDAVVGNPPYVRLRHLPAVEARRALSAAASVLGEEMDPAGSVWMPFVLHSTRFLKPGARMALVLPYDLTYVRYARPLWAFLGRTFGDLRIVRVRERLFPDILQETVLFYADDFRGSTRDIRFEAFETCDDFLASDAVARTTVAVADVVAGDRVFAQALLDSELRQLLQDVIQPATVTVEELATIRIGYVAGDKTFFHPTESVIREFPLSATHLRPALTSSRQLRHQGVLTSHCAPNRLFSPPSNPEFLSEADRRYIAHGETLGISERYKCRIRDPWYVVPGVRIPDLIFPVFAERPLALVNDGGFAASNSLLCGYVTNGCSSRAFVTNWYTSLTSLQLELQVHALGGGVFVLVPREVSSMRAIRPTGNEVDGLHQLDVLVANGDFDGAIAWGNAHVLAPALDLSTDEIALIEEGSRLLAGWRAPAQTPG